MWTGPDYLYLYNRNLYNRIFSPVPEYQKHSYDNQP